MNKPISLLVLVMLCIIAASGCGAAPTSAPTLPAATLAPSLAAPTPAAATATTAPKPSVTAKPAPLPPEPRPIPFKASDGQALEGLYYPAAVNPAPLVVLMHWAPGDQASWVEIAYWLQNRGLGGKTPNPQDEAWLDSSWFPPVPTKQSLAVFTFTLRGCEGGCKSGFSSQQRLLDAQAAMQTASELEGVDPQRIVTIGASVGADGAADGCFWLNAQKGKGQCRGAMSLSPGGYLTVPYAEAVKTLQAEQPPKPAWCLYADGDTPSAEACKSASGNSFNQAAYTDSREHGMTLFSESRTPKAGSQNPNAMQLILDFLKQCLEL